jgi:hypothetical protein
LHREERGIVEHLEIDCSVRGVRGVMHVGADLHPHLRPSPFYMNHGPEELIDRPVHVHPFERGVVGFHEGHGGCATNRPGWKMSTRSHSRAGRSVFRVHFPPDQLR